MLSVSFHGWFQARLATDPDPGDEPRGISGTTFALAGEPDLDQVIRFQNPVAPRPFGQRVDVRVSQVTLDGTEQPSHVLVGGPVQLLDRPIFIGYNNVVTPAEREPIDPFHLEIRSRDGRVAIRRRDLWNPARPEWTGFDVNPALLERRMGRLKPSSERMAAATGISDYHAYYARRRLDLETLLATVTHPIERAALHKRIFEIDRADGEPINRLGYDMTYRFALNGPWVVEDPDGLLPKLPDTALEWPLELVMGAYDSDTLCAFTQGTLSIPCA